MRRWQFLVAGLVLVVLGCATFEVKTDFDRTVDFDRYKTFRWLEPTTKTTSLNDRRIRKEVEKAMAERGYTFSESEEADLVLTHHAGLQDKVDISTDYSYWNRPWYGGGGTVDTYQYTEGTLIIDMIDSRRDQLVWRGWATGDVEEGQDPERLIKEVVAMIMKKFPPKS